MSGLNEDSTRFLAAAFDDVSKAWLVRGKHDASDRLAPIEEGPAGSFDLPDDEDLYYCVSTVNGSRKSIDRVWVLVIDDVGKEISRDAFEAFFPLTATVWRESSAGSFQVTLLIDGGMAEDEYKALRRSMKANPIWGGAHGIDAARIFRLPQGTHTKSTRGGWKVRDERWTGVKHTPEDLWRALGQAGAPRVTVPTKAEQRAPSLGAVKTIMALLPNDGVGLWCASNQAWFDMAQALYGATDGEGIDIWLDWCSAQDQEADPVATWNRAEPHTLGWRTLTRLANDRVQRGEIPADIFEVAKAQAAFDDGDPLEPEPEPEPSDIVLTPEEPGDTRKLPRRPWLYDRRLVCGFLSSTVAAGGTGKSSLAMVEALAMVTGKDLLGVGSDRMPRRGLRVLIWNGEDPKVELDLRFNAVCKHHGVVAADFAGALFMVSGRDRPLRIGHPTHEKKDLAWLRGVIKGNKIDVVIIDPFVSSHRVSENDNTAVDEVAKVWSKLAEDYHCAVDLVHHIRKPSNGGVVDLSVDDARGASALVNASRNARVLSPMSDKVAKETGVANRRSHFAVMHDATKANMSPSLVGASWFRFVSVDMGNGDPFPLDGGRPIAADQVGVIEAWVPLLPVANDPVKIIAAQAAVAAGTYRRDAQSNGWVGEPVAKALGLDPIGDKAIVKGIVGQWIGRGYLVVVERMDSSRHPKSYVEKGAPPPTFED